MVSNIRAYKDCEYCKGTGMIDQDDWSFNPRDMEFYQTTVQCGACKERYEEDYCSYLEERQE